MDTCPVCKQNGATDRGNVAGRDARAYDCPRCGRFGIDGLTRIGLDADHDHERYLVTAALRRASDDGQFVVVDRNNVDAVIASAPRWHSLFDGVDRLLLLLADRAPGFLSAAKFNKDVDYPLLCAKGERGMNELLTVAGQLHFFNPATSQIELKGWQRIDELRRQQPNARQAFVAMWFDSSMEDAWLHGLKPGVDDTEYFVAERVNSSEHNDKIDDRIIALIRRSGLVVADFTGGRGGVYFEAGFALGLGIPVVWTCRKDWEDKLHFDTRQYNHIIWNDPADLRVRLRDRLNATVVPRLTR